MKVLLSSEQHEQAVSWLFLWKVLSNINCHSQHTQTNEQCKTDATNKCITKTVQQWLEMHALTLTQCSVIVAIISAYPILMNELLNINELNDYNMLLALLILLVWANSIMKMALDTEKEQMIFFVFVLMV